MQLEVIENGRRLTARLEGDLRWNDRVRLSALARVLRETTASELALDCGDSTEADVGCLGGMLATAERMALVEGLRFVGRTA